MYASLCANAGLVDYIPTFRGQEFEERVLLDRKAFQFKLIG